MIQRPQNSDIAIVDRHEKSAERLRLVIGSYETPEAVKSALLSQNVSARSASSGEVQKAYIPIFSFSAAPPLLRDLSFYRTAALPACGEAAYVPPDNGPGGGFPVSQSGALQVGDKRSFVGETDHTRLVKHARFPADKRERVCLFAAVADQTVLPDIVAAIPETAVTVPAGGSISRERSGISPG